MRLNIAVPIIGSLVILIGIVGWLAYNHSPSKPVPPTPAPEPELVIPSELSVVAGDMVTIKAQSKGKIVKWDISGVGLQFSVHDNEIYFVAKAPVDGKVYKIWLHCYTSVNDVPFTEKCVITVNPSGPAPPGPSPVPPGPIPPPSQLAGDLQKLYLTEEPQKATNVKLLTAVYRLTPNLMDDKSILTADSMLQIIAQTAKETIPANGVPTIRERIAVEIDNTVQQLTDPTAPMTDANRAALKKVFSQIYTALTTVK